MVRVACLRHIIVEDLKDHVLYETGVKYQSVCLQAVKEDSHNTPTTPVVEKQVRSFTYCAQ